MGTITESASFDQNVYEIETSDPVLGGPNGPQNKAPQNLANRTNWLRAVLRTVMAENDIVPDDTNIGQFLAALNLMIAGAKSYTDTEIDALTNALDQVINNETTARQQVDQNLQQQLDDEIARATQAENSISYIANNIISGSSTAGYISFKAYGVIFQWSAVYNQTEGSLINLTTVFPNACLGALVSVINRSSYISSGGAMTLGTYNHTKYGFNLTAHDNNGSAVSTDIYYLAIGF